MNILVTGSIAFDYLMRFPGRFKEAIVLDALDQVSLSFLVDEMTKHNGGVAANIAYNMALLGSHPKLFGTAGRDFKTYGDDLVAIGVDTSTVVVLEDVFTASFFANTDLDNNQIATFYAGAMGRAGEYGIFDVMEEAPELVIVSPNAPEAMDRYIAECIEHNIPYLYDPSQQTPRTDGPTLQKGIMNARYVTVNDYEWKLIQQKTQLTLDEVRDADVTLIVTHGKNGSSIHTPAHSYRIPIMDDVPTKDPTGSGDAFRAGLLRGIELGWDWEVVGRVGALTATYAVEAVGTQNHNFTIPDFIARYRQHHDDEGQLDALLAEQSS